MAERANFFYALIPLEIFVELHSFEGQVQWPDEDVGLQVDLEVVVGPHVEGGGPGDIGL